MAPRNFSWIRRDELAAAARPMGIGDLMALREQGISAIVSLSERPLSSFELDECGIKSLHLPVPDFTAPTIEQIQEFEDFIEDQAALGRPVLVHCASGYGRSGTMAACHLVRAEGLDASDAIARVRALRPGSIETADQEQVIQQWAEHLRSRKSDSE